jgi:transposase
VSWKFRHKRQDIMNLTRGAERLGLSREARLRLSWFAYACAHAGNVSLTCRYFGISRSTFLRWAKRFDPRNPETLEENSRRPHRVRQSAVDPAVVALITQYRTTDPSMGKERIQQKLREEHGVTISTSTVGRVIARHKLFFGNKPSHTRKRANVDAFVLPVDTLRAERSASTNTTTAPEADTPPTLPASDFPIFGS